MRYDGPAKAAAQDWVARNKRSHYQFGATGSWDCDEIAQSTVDELMPTDTERTDTDE